MYRLFSSCWGSDHIERDFTPVLDRSLGYFCALEGHQLIGFINIAWDGGIHAFLLDTCVDPLYRRRGIATKMVRQSLELVETHGVKWVHVDFEPHLEQFYAKCGFRPTQAGLIRISI
ncbi:MAG: GNAT family N-acetyltransferase [Roseibium sp.]